MKKLVLAGAFAASMVGTTSSAQGALGASSFVNLCATDRNRGNSWLGVLFRHLSKITAGPCMRARLLHPIRQIARE
jgi:hypothetical protein